MSAQESSAPARRTRLTPERERELFIAVVGLVREHGYEALTMDAVAARTKASKATLYRQWESKPKLVATALRHLAGSSPTQVDTGSLAGDLRQMVGGLVAHSTEYTALISGLAHAVTKDRELWRALHALLIRPALEGLDAMVGRAVERGELDSANPAKDYIVQLILGAFSARRIIENKDVDTEYMEGYLVAVVFPALGIG